LLGTRSLRSLIDFVGVRNDVFVSTRCGCHRLQLLLRFLLFGLGLLLLRMFRLLSTVAIRGFG
jgi:hypothetical protein